MSLKANDAFSIDADVSVPPAFSGPETAVVIPVYNQLDYTRTCLESLRTHGKGIREIIVIDNGSMNSMAEYVSGLDYVRFIRNEENLGCAAAWNQGLNAARSPWVLFLNNDVVVTSGWLEGMLEFAEEKRVDIVSPAIREGACNYDIDSYAEKFVTRMKSHARIGVADGICFLVRRAVFEKVGGFDENFLIGQFEDVDFFRRAAMAGFRLGITGRSFIHHFGSVTRKHIRSVEKNDSFEAANRAYYNRKWNLSWYKRLIIRRFSKARLFFWGLREKALGGHLLKGERG
ncbi:MAG: glycosyltransferase family 2 protein [Syntrophobacteraceae bacterium]